MFRPSSILPVFKQLSRIQNVRCQKITAVGCRLCSTLHHSSPAQPQQLRHHSTAAEAEPQPTETEAVEPIPVPHVEGQEKTFSPKVQSIVNDIANLTLLEVADLNELLKKTLNITSTPMMAAGAMPAAAAAPQEEEEVEKKQEKVSFSVKLVKFDAAKKVALIKEIKSLMEGMNLVQAKKFVESAPQNVKSDITKDEAEKLKEALTAVGAEVTIE